MDIVRETTSLIAADKVQGTAVYNGAGEDLGSIYDVMIDKKSGNVAYAIMSFGGFLGIGNNYHPIPWSLLKYDTSKGGYVVNLDRHQLEGAPSYATGTDPGWGNREYETRLHDYYGVGPYWGSMW
jgi:sporulation protein YlmC with PRC-barrel domain